GVAERVEDGAELGADQLLAAVVLVHPHVLVREGHVLGEGAVALDPDGAGADAHLTATGTAVAAHPAHHVALAGDAVAHAHVPDLLADLDHLAVELVPGREGHCIAHGLGGGVPVQDVQVGAADPGAQHPHLHVPGPAAGLLDVRPFQPGPGRRLAQGAHRTSSSVLLVGAL